MKLFHFYRAEDHSGVSGTGPVVEGVQFTNGWCALRWISTKSSICFYQSIEDVKAIHSHGGKTEVIIHDFEAPARKSALSESPVFELFLQIIEEISRVMNHAQDGRDASAQDFRQIRELLAHFEARLKPPKSAAS